MSGWRRYLAFGSGVGIEIGEHDLSIELTRVRPGGVDVAGHLVIAGFRKRPAAEWGAEYAAFLKSRGAAHLSASVLLPRSEVIVRQIALPGVADKDVAAAIGYQIDALHPYGDEEVAYGWSRLDAASLLVAVIRQSALDRYLALFQEAGVSVASFSFSAAAMWAARRLPLPVPAEVLAWRTTGETTEIFGQSAARRLFSAEFDMPAARAAALAASELRLPPDTPPATFDAALPVPRVNPVENNLAQHAPAYAAALSSACPRLAPALNLLPPNLRAANHRGIYVPTLVLLALALAVGGALFAQRALAARKYVEKLSAEIRALEPRAALSARLDRETETARRRTQLLDGFKSRTRLDLDALNALTRLVPPPAWASNIDITRDAATLSGETEQAAPMLQLLDASPQFRNSEFTVPMTRMANVEVFRIRTQREPGK